MVTFFGRRQTLRYFLDPFEGGDLIHEAVNFRTSGAEIRGELRMRKKAERAESIGDGDDDDTLRARRSPHTRASRRSR